ncbi:hypothetical protein QTP70_006992 [Hemibagrus guttatus]|uniref:Uncharacterized protein n=1 Tax=Hemibagrus guttatus TaxID=175788 RepID=A0AAE0QYW3_9TELE|nr:hypothetical protein QTP70_006992 [Hemibagrus guttatus]
MPLLFATHVQQGFREENANAFLLSPTGVCVRSVSVKHGHGGSERYVPQLRKLCCLMSLLLISDEAIGKELSRYGRMVSPIKKIPLG